MAKAAMPNTPLGSAWPDASQLMLLRAAVGPLDRAQASFAEWNAQTNWAGDLDPASYRLLPLVYARMRRIGASHPEMSRLRGIYRYSWCEAQTRIQAAEYAIEALNAAGIDVMASKGLALIAAHYETPALRPMSDIDLYVPRRRLADAIAALGQVGWHIADPRADRGLRDMSILHASVTMWHDKWGELDLHWKLMANVLARPVMTRFWARSQTGLVGRSQVRIPAPDDLLLHVIAHGVISNALSPIRWIPDAAWIVEGHGPAIDWADLLGFARRHGLAWRLVRGLHYLRDLAKVEIPEFVLRYQPSLVERAEQRFVIEPPGGVRPAYSIYVSTALLTAKIARDPDWHHLPRLFCQSMARRLARLGG
jgi:Uncharacterised nucleotidyltransferase